MEQKRKLKIMVDVLMTIGLLLLMRGIAILIAAYGVYAFIKREIISYLFLTVEFVFFDFEEPIHLFLIDYVAIMGLFILVAHYIMKGIRQWN